MEVKKFNRWDKINEEALPLAEFASGALFSSALAVMAWRMVFGGEDKETAKAAVSSMSEDEVIKKAKELDKVKSKEDLLSLKKK